MTITRTSPLIPGGSGIGLPATITLDTVYQHIAEHGENHICATCNHIEYIADSAAPHQCTQHNHPVTITTPACKNYTPISEY